MKRYIRSSHTSRSAALRALAQQLADDPEYTECEISVNADHNCVDIIFPDDTMYQVYPEETDPYDSYGYKYVYVGPNKGDYIKQKYKRTRRDWKPHPYLIKEVSRRTYPTKL